MGLSRLSNVAVGEADIQQPRIVSLKELRDKLIPLIGGYAWADAALNDLWLMGAPVPESAPCSCRDIRQCPHTKRVLLPGQFAKWWKDVADRQGVAFSAAKAMAGLGRR